jgi:hypothetical protein
VTDRAIAAEIAAEHKRFGHVIAESIPTAIEERLWSLFSNSFVADDSAEVRMLFLEIAALCCEGIAAIDRQAGEEETDHA